MQTRGRAPDAPEPAALHTWLSRAHFPSVPLDDFDLLGPDGFDPGATSLLDPSPYPDSAIFELLGFQPSRREGALVALRHGDREIFRPPPPEIHVYCAPTLAHGQHLA